MTPVNSTSAPWIQVEQHRNNQSLQIFQLFTYKRDAGSQQQDPDKQVLKLLNNQLPDALTWVRQAKRQKQI